MTSETASFSSRGSSTGSGKIYCCDFPDCRKSYSKPSLLEQHKRTHLDERPFRCPHEGCGKSFFRKSHLKVHIVSHEGQDNKPFHCSVCGKGVNTQQHLKRHEITHTKNFRCTYEGCGESFYKHQSLRHHVLSVHEKKLVCQKCNKSFSRPYRLAQHNIKFHSDSPIYQCDHQGCFGNFKTWSALQLHVKTEHPKLKCSVCGKGCVGQRGLESHMLVHDDNKNVKLWNCRYCAKGLFLKKIDLIKHYDEMHDGNIPEDLLKREEREKLRALLDENGSGKVLKLQDLQQGRYEQISSDEDEENLEDNDNASYNRQDSVKSLRSLNSTLVEGNKSIKDLIQTNVSKKVIPCPKTNCDRKFSRNYDLQRHLTWHDAHLAKIELYLNSLEYDNSGMDKTSSTTGQKRTFTEVETCLEGARKENNIYEDKGDLELDDLIDLELKALRAGAHID